MTSSIQTLPATIVYGAKAEYNIGIDCTQLLAGYPGASPESPTVEFKNDRTGVVVSLTYGASVNDMVVSQRLTPSDVSPGQMYQLTLTVAPSTASSDVQETVLFVTVPGFS